jgi:hypothetical protein
MGRRYQAVLNYQNIPYIGVDEGDAVPNQNYTGVLIATPTETHVDLIEFYNELGLPILCEKPIAKDTSGLKRALKCEKLTMVNQYEYLVPKGMFGETYYDYYNSGKDGPGWDCINIIGLNAGSVPRISNTSPIWKCQINGIELNIRDMDSAYCRMIDDWVKRPDSDNREYIERAHLRVMNEDYIYES